MIAMTSQFVFHISRGLKCQIIYKELRSDVDFLTDWLNIIVTLLFIMEKSDRLLCTVIPSISEVSTHWIVRGEECNVEVLCSIV